MFDIVNNSSGDITSLLDILEEFIPYSQEQMGWREPVSLFFQSDEENANKILGRTAYYDPTEFSITVYVDGRHPKDILRSLSHELVHHDQNCRGDFENGAATEEGYAQKDPHMRNMELEAYEKGNIIFRDFEDLIKAGKINVTLTGEPIMSLKEWKDNEVNRLLMEKWGFAEKKFGPKNEEQQIFAPSHYCAHHVRENRSGREGHCVDHNWNEVLQEVTQYDVQFSDGDIKTLHIDEITVLEAHDGADHGGHVARKDDGKERCDEEGNRPSFEKKMGLKGVREAARPRQVADAPVDKEAAKKETQAAEDASTSRVRSGPTASSDIADLRARQAQHARGKKDPGKRAGTVAPTDASGKPTGTADPRKGARYKEREDQRKDRTKEKRQPKSREEEVADVVAQKERGKLPTPSEKRSGESQAQVRELARRVLRRLHEQSPPPARGTPVPLPDPTELPEAPPPPPIQPLPAKLPHGPTATPPGSPPALEQPKPKQPARLRNEQIEEIANKVLARLQEVEGWGMTEEEKKKKEEEKKKKDEKPPYGKDPTPKGPWKKKPKKDETKKENLQLEELANAVLARLQEAEGAVRRPESGLDRGVEHSVATAVDTHALAGLHGSGEVPYASHAGTADLQDLAARKKLGFAGLSDPGKHSGAREKFSSATSRDVAAAGGDIVKFLQSPTARAGFQQRDDAFSRRENLQIEELANKVLARLTQE